MLSITADNVLTVRALLDKLADVGAPPAVEFFKSIGLIDPADKKARRACKRILSALAEHSALKSAATCVLLANFPRGTSGANGYGEYCAHGGTVRGWRGVNPHPDIVAEREAAALDQFAELTGAPLPLSALTLKQWEAACAPADAKNPRTPYPHKRAADDWEMTLSGFTDGGAGGKSRLVKRIALDAEKDRRDVQRAGKLLDVLSAMVARQGNASAAAVVSGMRQQLTSLCA